MNSSLRLPLVQHHTKTWSLRSTGPNRSKRHEVGPFFPNSSPGDGPSDGGLSLKFPSWDGWKPTPLEMVFWESPGKWPGKKSMFNSYIIQQKWVSFRNSKAMWHFKKKRSTARKACYFPSTWSCPASFKQLPTGTHWYPLATVSKLEMTMFER